MAAKDQVRQDHWWVDDGENVLHEAQGTVLYQKASSVVRRRFGARFFLTDQRIVAIAKRGRLARRGTLAMNLPRSDVMNCSVEAALRMPGSYHRPGPSRRVLRFEIDRDGLTIVGLVLRELDAQAWLVALRSPPTRDGEAER